MSDVLKSLSRHTLIYGAGIVLSRAAGFLMIPIYTRYLAPEDYGVLELLDLFVYVVGILIAVAIRSSVNRFYYDSEEEEDRRSVIATAFLSASGISLWAAGILLLFAGELSRLIFQTAAYAPYIRIVLGTFWVNTVAELGFVYLQAQQKSMLFSAFSFARLVLTLSLNILFLVGLGMGVEGVLVSGLLAGSLFAVLLGIRTLRTTGFRFGGSIFREMLRYGLPLVPAQLATYILHFSDRFFLERLSSLHDVGIYALGYKFGMVLASVVTAPFISIWVPKRYEIAGDPDAHRIYPRVFTWFNMLICFAALLLGTFARELIGLVAAPSYFAAWQAVPLVALAYVFDSWLYHFNTGFHLRKRTAPIAWMNMAAAALNLTLNYFLIRQGGYMGAALATALTFGIRAVVYIVVSYRTWDVRFDLPRNLAVLASAGALCLGALAVPASWGAGGVALKGLIVLAYPGSLFLLGGLTMADVRKVAAFGSEFLSDLAGRMLKRRGEMPS